MDTSDFNCQPAMALKSNMRRPTYRSCALIFFQQNEASDLLWRPDIEQ
jgi:hypothetical protein